MERLTHRRLSRRMLLTDLGAAGLGIAILGACGGSSSDSESTGATAAGTDAAGTDPPATNPTATEPPASDPPATEPPASEPPAAPLQLQQVSLGFVSAYVLVRGSEAAIVDTGTPGSDVAILDGLSVLGASFSDVRHVVLTHNHGDHVGSLGEVLEQASSARVYAGEADIAAIASSLPLQAVGDGDEVFGMGVLNTPGHTAGSISLFDTGTGILVAGDAINGDGAGGLVGANPDFSDDMTAAGESIAKLAALDVKLAAFGHGGAPVDNDVMAQLAAIASTG